MQNLDAIWSALDALALEVATVNRAVGVEMLARNRALMLGYQQLAGELATLQAQPSQNGKPKAEAKP